MFISALLKIKKDKTSSDDFPKKEASKRKTFDLKTLRPFAVILIILAQTYCFEFFGYLMSIPLAIIALMLAMGQYNYKIIVLNAIGVTGVLFVLFDQILGLSLI